MLNKGYELGKAGRPAEQLPMFQQVIDIYGNDPDPEIRRSVGLAISNKAKIRR